MPTFSARLLVVLLRVSAVEPARALRFGGGIVELPAGR
jgi:hypothetical protein